MSRHDCVLAIADTVCSCAVSPVANACDLRLIIAPGFSTAMLRVRGSVLREVFKRQPVVDDAGNLMMPTQVSWYNYDLHPSKRFLYWAHRHLRQVPAEWRTYYKRLLRSEIVANRMANKSWDIVILNVEGYRKGKWVVNKYGGTPDEASIPFPYNNFWEETTHEERTWAFRRSFQLKELQALQRDDSDDAVFGSVAHDSRTVEATYLSKQDGGSRGQHGTPVHSDDLPAPTEAQIRDDEDMSHIFMSTIIDDDQWNPSLKRRQFEATISAEDELTPFEDEMDDDDEIDDRRPLHRRL
jgi:hypothetical protein